jgi:hypothetical protein
MDIIDLLVTRFKATFTGVKSGIFGVVDVVEKEGKIINYIGSEKVVLDDKYDVQLYFQQRETSQNNNYDNGFGDGFETIVSKNYSIIVYAKKQTEDNIYNAVLTTLYQNLTYQNKLDLGVNNLTINITNFDNDKFRIYNEELGNVVTKLNPLSTLLKFDITIEINKYSNCQTVCQ